MSDGELPLENAEGIPRPAAMPGHNYTPLLADYLSQQQHTCVPYMEYTVLLVMQFASGARLCKTCFRRIGEDSVARVGR